MRLDHVPRLMRTVRHLRSSQIWWRTRYFVERRLPQTLIRTPEDRPDAQLVLREGFPAVPLFHRQGPTGGDAVDRLARGEFRHLNRTVNIGFENPDWLHGGDHAGRLWSVTLHYHGWVYDLAEAAVQGDDRALPVLRHYLEHWLERCRLRQIGPNNLIWNAFAIATRASWWVRALRLLQEHRVELPGDFLNRWQQSLLRQAHFLSRHLEWDLRGNHILRDAVGLAWVGRHFTGRRPDRWLRIATEIAESQASEQILPDGAHFERSPMYHIHVMEDFLSLSKLLPDENVAARMRDSVNRMVDFAAWMRHPDGTLPLFNDAAQHAVCDPQTMLQMVAEATGAGPSGVPRGLKHFDHAGSVVWQGDPWSVFWDIGDVGPGYQPGHAHADTLTFECSYQGQRLIVDPGTFGYDRDDRRRYDRSTAAHNTVCIDDRDSSEVWHIFRVGRRARPIAVDIFPHVNGFSGYAAHTGYNNLPGQPRHGRRVSVAAQRELRIVDQIDGRGTQRLSGGYLLAPEWKVTPQATGWRLTCGNHAVDVYMEGRHPLTLAIETQPWHPEYGLEIETRRLVWRTEAPLPTDIITIIRPAD